MIKNKQILLNHIKSLIEEDVKDYLSLYTLCEDDFWNDDKWIDHHNRHVKYNETVFNPSFSYSKREVRFPSFADSKKVLDLKYNYSDELDDEVYYESLNNYLKEANDFMNDETITDGYMTRDFTGRYTNYVLIKYRPSKNPAIRHKGFKEYVMYEPIYNKDGKLIRRKVISYGLTFNDVVYANNGRLYDYDPELKVENSLKKSKYEHYIKLKEGYLTEANRQQLLQKSRNAKHYKNMSKGKNRYERRLKSRISATIRDYNNIQMDQLFKRDILEIKIPVMGETDVYEVDVKIEGLLKEVQKQIQANKGILEFKVILQSLMKTLNVGNVWIGCNCLYKDTKIKLLDGTTPTVEEMCERFKNGEKLWVYSTDEKGDFKPGEVEKVWKTGDTSEFIKVTLDNGQEILTTPEHPYMLRDGTYCFAAGLKEGQSLMPMYFNYHNDYEQVKLNTETRGWRSIYKLVAECLKHDEIQEALYRVFLEDNMPCDVAIHHKDFNKHNNNPENLQIMIAREHWDYHASLTWDKLSEETKEHIRQCSKENAIKRNENPTENMLLQRQQWQESGRLRNYDKDRKQQQSEIAKNYLVPNSHKFTSEELSVIFKEAWRRGCFDTKKFHEYRVREGKKLFNNSDNQSNMRKCKMKKVLQRMLEENIPLTEENYNIYRLKTHASKATSVFESFDAMISEFKLNHKVVKVERISLENTPVYDIKVKEWENFVVDAGVVLHNCPDAKYRMAYWQTQDNYKAGYRETRPSNVTNPYDDLGAGCKHTMLILANLDWCVKVASVINNYIKYCQEHLEQAYADYIFPKVYGIKYNKAVQMDLFYNGMLPDDKKTKDEIVNKSLQGKDKQGKFVKDNPYKFQKKDLEEPNEEKDQIKLDLEEPKEKELKIDSEEEN